MCCDRALTRSRSPSNKGIKPLAKPLVTTFRLCMRMVLVFIYLMLTLALAQQSWSPKFGVSFRPFGGFVGLEFITQTSNDSNTTSINTALIGYDTTLDSHLGIQATLRHESKTNTILWGVQIGSWEHDPHLLDNTETALGIQGDATFNTSLANQSLQLKSQLGLLHLQSYRAFQIEALVSANLYQETLDAWGYRQTGYGLGFSALWGATPEGGVLGVWADAYYTHPQFLLTPNDVVEVALRIGYKPEELVPILRFQDWAALFSAGYRSNLPVSFDIAGVASLERLTLEPKVRVYVDGYLNIATDIAIGADVLINEKPSSLILNVGYAESLWFKLGFLSPF